MQAKFTNVLPKEEWNEVDSKYVIYDQLFPFDEKHRATINMSLIMDTNNTIDCSQMIIKSGYFTLHTHCYVVHEDFRTKDGTVSRYSQTFHTAHAD
jgi:hypothetical protein